MDPQVEIIQSMAVEVVKSPHNAIRDVLQAMVKVDSHGVFFEPSCQFCHSRNRDAAEKLHANPPTAGDRDLMVKEFFAKVDENISTDSVKNHIKNHVNRASLELMKLEYIDHLTHIAEQRLTSLESVHFMMAVLRERVAALATVPDDSPRLVDMKTKAATSIAKAYAQQVEIQAKILGEMAGRGELIAIPKARFVQTMQAALQSVKSPEEQQAILKLFEEMDRCSEE